MKIPKIIHHVWLGPKPAPFHWIDSWMKHHPDWDFMFWDEAMIFRGKERWKNWQHIRRYMQRGQWPGVADLLRYEILYMYGGFNPGADSQCFRSIDELFKDDHFECYSPYENEDVRPGLIAPIHASVPGASFLKTIIDTLHDNTVWGIPWKTTGNKFIGDLVERDKPQTLKLWPSHYFIPNHYTGRSYQGDFKPYADHKFGTTKNLYEPRKP